MSFIPECCDFFDTRRPKHYADDIQQNANWLICFHGNSWHDWPRPNMVSILYHEEFAPITGHNILYIHKSSRYDWILSWQCGVQYGVSPLCIYPCTRYFWLWQRRSTKSHNVAWGNNRCDWLNPAPLFTKKTPSYQYRDSHYKPETVVRPS